MSEVSTRARRLMLAGAFVSIAGLALAGTVAPDLGLVVVGGWLLFAAGLHTFGRAE